MVGRDPSRRRDPLLSVLVHAVRFAGSTEDTAYLLQQTWVYYHPTDYLPVGTRDRESGGSVYQDRVRTGAVRC